MADFVGTGGNDVWTGGSGDETATGAAGNDTLSGAGGSDLIVGNSGVDTLDGGDGDDWLASGDVQDSFGFYGVRLPSLDTGIGQDTLLGGAADDRLFAGYGDNVDGGTGIDYLSISFMGATSGVTADFSLGTLTIGGGTIKNIESLTDVQGSDFDDYIKAYDSAGGYGDFTSIEGMGGNDTLIASYYTWTLDGGDGNDIVDGRNSQYLNAVYGGTGNDTLYTNSNTFAAAWGGDGDDTIYAHGEVHGGDGNDHIILNFSYYGGRVSGDAGDDQIDAAPQGSTIAGGTGADIINGSDSVDVLGSGDFGAYPATFSDDTGAEHDVINAAGGDDVVSIGYGDNADGGSGTDRLTLSLEGATAGVTINTTGLTTPSGMTIAGGTIKNFEVLERLVGTSFADRIILGTASELVIVESGAGNDTITTGGSSAQVDAGDGNDRVFSGIAADTIDGGDGRDIVDYRHYASAVHVDLQAGTGAGGDTIVNVESIQGSEFNDALYGDAGNNNITGNGGDDIIYGREGNDVLTGGAGEDRLNGGLGNDIYYVYDANDIVIESADEGYDSVYSTVSLTLRSNVERLVLNGTSAIDGTGNGLDNNITGNSGANVISGLGGNDFIVGGGGADHLDGGAGSDTYYVASFADYADAQIADTGVSGLDVLRFAGSAAGTLVLNAGDTGLEEVDVATSTGAVANFNGTTAIDVDASALASGIVIRGNLGANNLTGTDFNDNLYGNNGNDHLIGGGGNDVLDGGRGSDTMEGGVGSDDYYVDSASDVVIEAAGGGNDAVYSTISYTLGAEVENLTLLGSNNLVGTGNELNNSLTGNSARDTLLGMGGDDYLNGGLDNDTLKGGDGSDWMIGGAGQDQFYGEAGGDNFVFDDGDFAGMTTTTADRIHDFSQADGDKIRLEDVDANSLVAGDQAFAFIGNGVFSHAAGELRYEQVGSATIVEGDTNGDGVADFWIRLDGVHTLQAGDFGL